MRQPTAEKRSTHALPARIAAMERVVEAAGRNPATRYNPMRHTHHGASGAACELCEALAALDKMEGE